jgi:hypothetical protein
MTPFDLSRPWLTFMATGWFAPGPDQKTGLSTIYRPISGRVTFRLVTTQVNFQANENFNFLLVPFIRLKTKSDEWILPMLIQHK